MILILYGFECIFSNVEIIRNNESVYAMDKDDTLFKKNSLFGTFNQRIICRYDSGISDVMTLSIGPM